jgi:glutamyl endopeptidase
MQAQGLWNGVSMSFKKLIVCGFAAWVALGSAAALADTNETPESDSPSAPMASERAPSPGTPSIPSGAAWTGLGAIAEADLLAAGVQLEGEAAEADTLHPDIIEMFGEPGSETVWGWDSRMRMNTLRYPNRAIVYITYEGNHLCTGFMISPNVVATAGHCLHTGGRNGSWRNGRQMRVYPGRDGTLSPYGSCGVIRQYSVTGWTRRGLPNYDYGAQVLDCTVGNTVGWFGLLWNGSTRFFRDDPMIVAGYSGDQPQYQMLSADQIRSSQWARLCYRADTTGGNSGGPVWNDAQEALASIGAYAIGIHAYGGGCLTSMNWAPRIRQAVFNNYVNWINAN